jgi:hypothetical protein
MLSTTMTSKDTLVSFTSLSPSCCCIALNISGTPDPGSLASPLLLPNRAAQAGQEYFRSTHNNQALI